MSAKAIKTVRKVEKPRPLRTTSTKSLITSSVSVVSTHPSVNKSHNEIVKEIEALNVNLSNCNYDESSAADIERLCKLLKENGEVLDSGLKNFLDHCFVTIRNSSREDRLDMISRLKLLEIIEMRATRWQKNENIAAFYRKKIAELEGVEKPSALAQSFSTLSMLSSQSNILQQSSATMSIPLAAGEILRSSGKFGKPTKLAGKNYFKDEVVIRNSDSGKVSPGVRDRLVQITGPNEEAISYAKNLVEDTIRRNASPIRDKNDSSNINSMRMTPSLSSENVTFAPPKTLSHSLSMSDASNTEYSFRLNVGNNSLTVSGTNMELVEVAKSVLESCLLSKDQYIPPPISLDLRAYGDFNTKIPLQRSSSYISSGGDSRASTSPLESFSEDEPFTEHNLKTPHPKEIFTLPNTINDEQTLSAEQAQIPSPRMTYSKELLLFFSKSPLCKIKPYISMDILSICPMIVRGNHTFPVRKKDSSSE